MNDQDFENTGDESPDTTPTDATPTGDAEADDDRIPTDRRPLGFWLRTVDALISREFDSALADEGVTRRDWMLLNALSGDVDPALADRLTRRPKRLRGLERRGWVDEKGDGTWVLTDEGRAATERLGQIVDGIRSRVAGSVEPEAFATMTASLEAIARELGWDESSSPRESGRGRFFGPGFRSGDEPGFGPGFRGGFGPRPGFGPGFRPGFGPGFPPGFRPWSGFGPGPGFRPGFGPGFDPRRMWAADWTDEDGCHGEHGGKHGHHGHGHRHGGHPHHGHHGWDAGHGWGHDDRTAGHEHAAHGRHHEHAEHGARGAHGEHGRHGDEGRGDRHASEQAYERGFEAGYARGSAERD